MKHTELVKTEDDEFIVQVVKTIKEACELIDLGYGYVTEFRINV